MTVKCGLDLVLPGPDPTFAAGRLSAARAVGG
jgi:hypothetical protein